MLEPFKNFSSSKVKVKHLSKNHEDWQENHADTASGYIVIFLYRKSKSSDA
jgi:hypothetical protein